MSAVLQTISEEKEKKIEDYPDLETSVVQRLQNLGIHSLVDLASKSPFQLVESGKLDDEEAHQLIFDSLSLLHRSGWIRKRVVRASGLYQRRRKYLKRFSTGSSSLDYLLFGGAESQAITELYGEFSSGKTQICHTLSVISQVRSEESSGDRKKVLYIDTEGTFRPQRLYQIAETRGLDPEPVLENVLVAAVNNLAQFESVISQLGKLVAENRVQLIIVDSLIALYRAEFAGRGLISERQQKLNRAISVLRNVAEATNSAVVVTNQILVKPNSNFFGDPVIPAGGNIMAHGTTYRIYLRKVGRERVAIVQDSPYHPKSEARFCVSDQGCCDSPEEGQRTNHAGTFSVER